MHQFLKFNFGIKLYMFRTVPLSIIKSSSLYTQKCYISYSLADSLQAGSGRNWAGSRRNRSVLILLASCQQTCMTYTIFVRIVKKSWWWTEELPETCRVLFQKKFEKIMHLVGFIIRITPTSLLIDYNMDWIGLAQDRDRWRTFVSEVMNLRVQWNAGNFLTSC